MGRTLHRRLSLHPPGAQLAKDDDFSDWKESEIAQFLGDLQELVKGAPEGRRFICFRSERVTVRPDDGYRRAMSPIIDSTFASEFAAAWVRAWNNGDLEEIFSHYTDDFEMRSPLIAERGFSPTGVLRGKEAIRPYWGAGIAGAKPPLVFELLGAYAGVNTVAIHYRSVARKYVVEVIEFDALRRAIRGSGCYGAEA